MYSLNPWMRTKTDNECWRPKPVTADTGRSPRCRDRGRGGADAGALCLSSWGCDPHAPHIPDESSVHQDKHKAPSHPFIHPLSLRVADMGMTDLDGQCSLSAVAAINRALWFTRSRS